MSPKDIYKTGKRTMKDKSKPEREELGVSRRGFLQGTGSLMAATAVAPAGVTVAGVEERPAPVPNTPIQVTVNGVDMRTHI